MSGLAAFLGCCTVLPDGFAGLRPSAPWRVGGVLFATSEDRFAAVRKTARAGYEFSHLWALPGGMMRAPTAETSAFQPADSVAARAAAEAGLRPSGLSPLASLGPIVTRYTARGQQRSTIIGAFTWETHRAPALSPSDPSVDTAAWMPRTADLALFAPANRLILGHLLWAGLSAEHRDRVREPLDQALSRCSTWADEVGAPLPAAPWDPTDRRESWSQSWPQ